jgi:endonuclease/exonuclease/phosphatase family metal-dependent hydrolase
MAIKVVAWNVEGRLSGEVLSGRGSADHILEGIKELDADVLVLLEAYTSTLANGVYDKLRELGYEILNTAYEDVGRRKNNFFRGEMYMCILSRLQIIKVDHIRPGDIRNLLVCEVTDPASGKPVRIIATHLDDRSEQQRVLQVEELSDYISASDLPTIMLGDFNAMWHKGRALLIDSLVMRLIARCIPHKDLQGVLQRAIDMASGTSLSILSTKTRLREVDLRHRPTATPKRYGALWMPSVRLIQIDHMLVSPEITTENFSISADGGSDHRSISANILL